MCAKFSSVFLMILLFIFSMMATRGPSGPSEGSSLGSRSGHMDDQIQEFISSEITHSIFEQTPVIFGTIKEGIMVLMNERLGKFPTKMVAMVGVHSLTFREFCA